MFKRRPKDKKVPKTPKAPKAPKEPKKKGPPRTPLWKPLVGLAVVIAVLTGFGFGEFFRRQEKDYLIGRITNQAENLFSILASVSTDSLITEDRDLLGDIVNETMADGNYIRFIRFENEGGDLLATSEKGQASKDDPQFTFKRDITIKGENFGTIIVGFKSEELRDRLLQHGRVMQFYFYGAFLLVASIVFLLTGFFGVRRLQRIHQEQIVALKADIRDQLTRQRTMFEAHEAVREAPPPAMPEPEPVPPSSPETPVNPEPVQAESTPETAAPSPTEETLLPVENKPAEPAAPAPQAPEAAEATPEPPAPQSVAETKPVGETPAETPVVEAAAPAEAAPTIAETETPPPAAEEVKPKGTILMVDDEQAACKIVTRIMQEKGFTVLATEESDQGLELYKNGQIQADLVILPMVILEMLGDTNRIFTAFREVNPDIPILFSTATLETMTIPDYLKSATRVDYIEKPFDAEKILQKIAGLTGLITLPEPEPAPAETAAP